MICQVCAQIVIPITDELLANATVRKRTYICKNCGHNGEQWGSLQPTRVKPNDRYPLRLGKVHRKTK